MVTGLLTDTEFKNFDLDAFSFFNIVRTIQMKINANALFNCYFITSGGRA